MTLALNPSEKTTIEKILRAHLPTGSRVYVFGSRLSKAFKKYSDLDLAIELGSADKKGALTHIEEQFAQSELSFKIDMHEVGTLSPDFLKSIKTNWMLFLEI